MRKLKHKVEITRLVSSGLGLEQGNFAAELLLSFIAVAGDCKDLKLGPQGSEDWSSCTDQLPNWSGWISFLS